MGFFDELGELELNDIGIGLEYAHSLLDWGLLHEFIDFFDDLLERHMGVN